MIVAVIIDSNFAEPTVVVADNFESAYRAVASYLEAAAPVRVDTGERITPRPTAMTVTEWVSEMLDQTEDLSVDFLHADTVGMHQAWLLANREALRRTHEPRVKTIKVNPLHL